MTITKHFKTLQQAEDFTFDLYDKYYSVQLVSAPMCSEAGLYVWKVSNK